MWCSFSLGYLADRSEWSDYDATELVGALKAPAFDDVLIDVGTADNFLTGGQLLPEVISFLMIIVCPTVSKCFV